MKLRIEENSWNNYPSTHTSRPAGVGALLDLPCVQRQKLIDVKLLSGTTKYPKKYCLQK